MHEAHSHSAAGANAGRLRLVLLLTASFLAVEVVGGVLTGSLALIADAGHMLTDVAGTGMALIAIKFAARPATTEKTYGFYRLEILSALVNGLILFGIAGYILFEAYRRFSSPPEVQGAPMLAVAGVGLLVNLACAYLLMEGQKTSLNMHGAFLEVVSDFFGSLAVIVAGVVIVVSGFKLIDPLASVFIGLFILPRTWKLINDALHVLLEGVPRHIDMGEVRQHILEVEGVTSVHDLHVWSLTSGVDVISAHVVVGEGAPPNRVLDELCACLGDHFDIEHSTFQIEQKDRAELEHASH
jgi:cobalt-zinc-cadmium efflux system protein